jgi:repressor LexA
MRGSPTELEGKILDFMVAYLRENTYQPSIREIGERFGIKSTKTVSEHLQALANKGFLERDPSRSRGVKILGMDLRSQAVSVPCYAVLPTSNGLAPAKADLHLTFDRRLVGSDKAFCVRLSGEEVGAFGAGEGDLAMLVPAALDQLREGAIVAAALPGLGRFFRVSMNGRGLSVTPLGSTEPTVLEDPSLLKIVGRVVGVFGGVDAEVHDSVGAYGSPTH